MNAGKMRHRVIIQEPIESKGAMGGTKKTWVDFHTCWADIRELSTSDRLKNEQLSDEVKAVCYIRYEQYLDGSMRLLHSDNVYQMGAPINKDGKKAMLEIPLYEFR